MKAIWSKLIFTGRGLPPAQAADTPHVKKMVAANPGAIGYIEVNQLDNTVSVINTATKTSIKTIAVGKNPLGIAASPDGKYLYVTNVLDSTVTVIPV